MKRLIVTKDLLIAFSHYMGMCRRGVQSALRHGPERGLLQSYWTKLSVDSRKQLASFLRVYHIDWFVHEQKRCPACKFENSKTVPYTLERAIRGYKRRSSS